MTSSPTSKPRLTPTQRMQLALRAHRALITINRIYAGYPTATTTRDAVEHAARELGLPLPPQRAAHPQPLDAA